MIIDWPILSALVFTPAIGALFVLMIRGEEALVARNARWVALWTTLVTFGLALLAHAAFDSNISGFQLEETKSWLPTAGINYHLGVDGISLPFLLLTAFLMPICVLIGWQQIQTRVREYMIAFLLLESMLLGLFCALDLILFYLFFESVLIPMFLIIGIWGGAHRVHAAYKFFLFTLAGALPMLLAVIVLYQTGGTGDIGKLINLDLARNLQIWLFLGFLASFAIKLPMWPFHTWLPDAHTEAPTTGSIMLAGVLLKMGGYGFLRLSLPILPDACAMFAPTMFALAGIAVVYTSLIALAQHDLKKMIAYSSVAHMGFVVLGIFSLTVEGIAGALMQMISHGLVVTALFIAIGLLYERRGSRNIDAFGGLALIMPRFALLLGIFVMAAIGLPGTSGFVGQALSLFGAWRAAPWAAAFGGIGIVLGAAYMLMLMSKTIFGFASGPLVKTMPDLHPRELAALVPLAAVILWLGVHPAPVLNVAAAPVEALVQHMETRLDIPEQLAKVEP